jgi:hypothetical protein
MPVILQSRTSRAAWQVNKVNAATDPLRAAGLAGEYMTSILARAGRRDLPWAAGWAAAYIHLVDALAAAIERGEEPGSWFRHHGSWRLNPEGWGLIQPLADLLRVIARPPERKTA